MGGIGKTELARHFITEPELSSHYNRRFWFNAASPSQLRNEFYELAGYLGLIEPKKYIEDKALIHQLHRWFNINPGWLIIFDNADEYNSIAEWIPKEGGAVLITTRDPHPGTLTDEQIVKVLLLTEKEAIDWLYQLAQRDQNASSDSERKAAKELVNNLGYLPLAIAQASAYLRERKNFLIEEYQQDFMALLFNDKSFVKTKKNKNQDPSAYSRLVVASTWTLSLKAIETYTQKKKMENLSPYLLIACSYLAPKGIPVQFLQHWFKEFFEINNSSQHQLSYLIDEYIGQLLRYSLLERTSTNMLSIHSLVQEVGRSLKKEEDNNLIFLKVSIAIFCQSQKIATDNMELVLFKYQLIPHIKTFMEHMKSGPLLKPPQCIVPFYFRLTALLSTKGDWVEAKNYAKKALKMSTQTTNFPVEASVELWSLLGMIYLDLGKTKKGNALLLKALPGTKNTKEKITLLINQATAHNFTGEMDKRKKLLEEAWQLCSYPDDDINRANILINLAQVYKNEINEAKELLQWAKTIQQKHYQDEKHIELVEVLHNLAICYKNMEKPAKGKKLAKQSLAILKNFYDDDKHIKMAGPLMTLGLCYGKLNNLPKKKKMIEQALSIKETFYGEHPEIVNALINLSNIYREAQDFNEAEELLKRAYAIQIKNFNIEHEEVVDIKRYLDSLQEARELVSGSFTLELPSGGLDFLSAAAGLTTKQILLYSGQSSLLPNQSYSPINSFWQRSSLLRNFSQPNVVSLSTNNQSKGDVIMKGKKGKTPVSASHAKSYVESSSSAAAAAAPVSLAEHTGAASSSSQALAAAPALLSHAPEIQVLATTPTKSQASAEAIVATMTEETAIKILDKAKQAIVHREIGTLKAILPLVDNYSDKVLNLLADELKKNALRTNPWLYIGLATVLQKAFIEPKIRNKIGQASLLSLLKRIVNLFNESVIITTGDQTVPYLALDVLNLCFMNLNELGINLLPKSVIEEIVAKLTAIKPASSDISDVIKMQREFAENMLKSINADIGVFDIAKPHLVAGGKVILGLGFVMGGIGAIALTGSAAQGAKLMFSGATMTISGGWAFYQFIMDQQSSWYPEILKTYKNFATSKEPNSQQEEKLKTELETIRKEGNLKKYGVGLLGIIYQLVQLYPDIKQQPVKNEIIDTLAAMAYKPDQSNAADDSESRKGNKLYPKPFLRKNALLALKYIAKAYDSYNAATQYERCLATVKYKDNLTQAIDRQYSFFSKFNTFMNDISVQFSNVQPTLLEEVLEDEKIRESQLKQAQTSQDANNLAASYKINRPFNIYGKATTLEADVACATEIPLDKVDEVLSQQREIAKGGVNSAVTLHAGSDVGTVKGGMFNMHFAPSSSKDKKKHRKKEKSEKKGKSASSASAADSNEQSKLSGPRTS